MGRKPPASLDMGCVWRSEIGSMYVLNCQGTPVRLGIIYRYLTESGTPSDKADESLRVKCQSESNRVVLTCPYCQSIPTVIEKKSPDLEGVKVSKLTYYRNFPNCDLIRTSLTICLRLCARLSFCLLFPIT